MKLRWIFLVIVLFPVWSSSPDAWGLIRKGQIFTELQDQDLPHPTESTAVIVFFLPYELDKDVGRTFIPFMGSPVGKDTSLIYDVTSETPKLAGAIKPNTKFAYVVPAGKHLFQSIGLLEANVVGGRTYYVLVVEPLMSRLKSELFPVRNGGRGEWQYSNEFRNYLEKAVLVETTPKAYKEYEKKMYTKYLNQLRDKELVERKSMSKHDLFRVTLNPEDGILAEQYADQGNQISLSKNNDPSLEKPSIDGKTVVSTSTAGKPESINSMPTSYYKELEALEALRNDGIFTEEEFQIQKAKLLQQY